MSLYNYVYCQSLFNFCVHNKLVNNISHFRANLSNDYFTDRQDRYFIIKNCKEFSDFHENLVSRVCDFSFRLNEDNTTDLNPNWKIHPSEGDQNEFIAAARSHVNTFYESCRRENVKRLSTFVEESAKLGNEDTWIFPILQMGPLHVFGDQFATSKVFENAPSGSQVKLATGYFNLTADYIQKIVDRSDANYDILMAHPKVFLFIFFSFQQSYGHYTDMLFMCAGKRILRCERICWRYSCRIYFTSNSIFEKSSR